jgi:rhodanese-related sulfurtransferase
METRIKFSLLLILLGILLAFLPLSANRSFTVKPLRLLSDVLNKEASFSVDQIAEFMVREDSTIQLIDLRSSEESKRITMPGAINIPYPEFIQKDPEIYLNKKAIKNIFFSNGDIESSYALVYARGLGYKNTYLMEGGVSEWSKTIIETRFSGDRITARENALFETRKRAGEMFTELNSLPDSLKTRFLESKRFSAKKLDGGCE